MRFLPSFLRLSLPIVSVFTLGGSLAEGRRRAIHRKVGRANRTGEQAEAEEGASASVPPSFVRPAAPAPLPAAARIHVGPYSVEGQRRQAEREPFYFRAAPTHLRSSFFPRCLQRSIPNQLLLSSPSSSGVACCTKKPLPPVGTVLARRQILLSLLAARESPALPYCSTEQRTNQHTSKPEGLSLSLSLSLSSSSFLLVRVLLGLNPPPPDSSSLPPLLHLQQCRNEA